MESDPDWAGIFEEYRYPIRSYIYGRVGDPELADDLTADVFAKAIAAHKEGRGATSNLRGWLYKIATHLVIDHYRRQGRITRSVSLEDYPDLAAASDLELVEDGDQVARAIGRLSEGQARVILWTVAGYSGVEVGALLGSSETAAKSLLHRARVSLRKMLAEMRSEGQ